MNNNLSNASLQWVLDELHPASACGRELLRDLRPGGPGDQESIERELDDVQRLAGADAAQWRQIARLAHAFSLVKDLRRTFVRCREVALGEVELFEVKSFLMQVGRIAPQTAQLAEDLGVSGAELDPCTDALQLLDVDGQGTAAFSVSSRYSQELAAVRQEKRQIEDEIRRTGAVSDDLQAQRTAVLAREQREEEAICLRLSQELQPSLDAMEEDLRRIARLDLLIEKARLARTWGAVRPQLGGSVLRLTGMFDPYVVQTLRQSGGEFTPVDIELRRGPTVITGANMGGKSVALRAVVLNALLAHMGFFVFAQQAEVPLFDEIILIAEDGQSVQQGLSSFGAEITALDNALTRCRGRFCLLVFDEFARGTNPEEGRRIVSALVRYLADKNSIALLATHYDGAARYAAAHYQVAGLRDVDPAALKREIEAGGGFQAIRRHMDYRLLPAGAFDECPRSALTICRLLLTQKDLIEVIEEGY